MEAAREAVRQLRLRAQGGIAAIDFVSMREAPNRKAVEQALKAAVLHDPWNPIFAPMSRFGVVELSRAQYSRPIRDVLLDADGRKSIETVALETLRMIERETNQARGRKIVAGVAPDVATWLEAKEIPWREALEARIGGYWEIEPVKTLARERIDVRAV